VVDERLLAGVRRYWSQVDIETAYQAVLQAYASNLTKEVVITGTLFDGQSASGQFVLDRAAMAGWLDVLEYRLQEIEADAAGDAPIGNPDAPSADFSRRRLGT
jgi:hypothetical protein